MMVHNIKDNIDSNEGIETDETIKIIKKYLLNPDSEIKAIDAEINESNIRNLYYLELNYFVSIFTTGIDPLMFISDLERCGTILHIAIDDTDLPKKTAFDPEKFYLKWTLFFETDKDIKELEDIFCFVVDESQIKLILLNDLLDDVDSLNNYSINGHTITEFRSRDEAIKEEVAKPKENEIPERRKTDRRNRESGSDSYIRVPTEKLEKIFNTVSELLISQARLNMLTDEFEESIPDSFSTVTDSLKNITQLIQEQVTSLRMMNLGSTFDRFKRVVRDIASDRGKKIKLQVEGQDTELDKNMIEKLNDPLKHLVRNCIDHGIETQDERTEKGKSPEGLLKLLAYLESGKVVIEVSDDGKGIDKEKLLQKAEDKGIVSKDNRISDGEILNLIFHPGLSTAEKVTDLSGRGVGMDVVKNSINELHGNIDIISEKDVGTTFKLYLPLTLAILDGMLISVGIEKYIIPTLSILEIFRPESFHLKSVSGGEELVFFRGNYIPLIRLHNIFSISNPINDPEKAELIVINSGGIKAAILVDNVLEQYQIVLKSLQRNFRRVEHITSATILGDGDVALILDIQSLVENNKKAQNV